MLTYEDYYSCAENVKQHAQFEKFLESAVFDKKNARHSTINCMSA